ncbi:hypothetical protein E2C01_039061 [Portunus trituberculatus]|uniref:Uncharacterized protein n=1 Tax=Portunus trituberculatus TaxID=210409 RepID=A0A5B7FJP8_PORTR|nr:hypothetical protein [Portunus trituberculatus]
MSNDVKIDEFDKRVMILSIRLMTQGHAQNDPLEVYIAVQSVFSMAHHPTASTSKNLTMSLLKYIPIFSDTEPRRTRDILRMESTYFRELCEY